MFSNAKKGSVGIILAAVVVIVLIAAGSYLVGKREVQAPAVPEDVVNVDRSGEDGNTPNTDNEPSLTSSVKVPVFAEGGNLVCGVKQIMIERPITPTAAPLGAAYRELFSMSEPFTSGGVEYQNPIGYQVKKTDFPKLSFDRVDLKDGVASVYLKGSLTGVGTCYDPLPKMQLDAVAKQFAIVKSVKYYLNNKPFDPGSIADQR